MDRVELERYRAWYLIGENVDDSPTTPPCSQLPSPRVAQPPFAKTRALRHVHGLGSDGVGKAKGESVAKADEWVAVRGSRVVALRE